ncbi:MAG: hypothetical protein FWD91_04405, partial [Treponema sp.]|nr:hypothetical protein [Treponema sp.]
QEAIKILSGLELQEAQWILKYLELHEQRIKEFKTGMQREAKEDEDMKILQTIPGVGTAAGSARGRR